MKKTAIYLILITATGMLSSCDDIFEKDISAEDPVIFSPAEGRTFSHGDVLFWWDYLPEAEYYQVQIARPEFALIDKLVTDTIVETNKLVINLEEGNYEWRIRACNSAYCTAFLPQVLVISGK